MSTQLAEFFGIFNNDPLKSIWRPVHNSTVAINVTFYDNTLLSLDLSAAVCLQMKRGVGKVVPPVSVSA